MLVLFQVWNLTNCKLKTNHYGHTGFLNCVTVSPDGSLCASGGKVRFLALKCLVEFFHNTSSTGKLTDSAAKWLTVYGTEWIWLSVNGWLISCIYNRIYSIMQCNLLSIKIGLFAVWTCRMDKLCCGTWTKESTCTLWTAATSSMPSPSVPTDTGYVLQLDKASKSGYVILIECLF